MSTLRRWTHIHTKSFPLCDHRAILSQLHGALGHRSYCSCLVGYRHHIPLHSSHYCLLEHDSDQVDLHNLCMPHCIDNILSCTDFPSLTTKKWFGGNSKKCDSDMIFNNRQKIIWNRVVLHKVKENTSLFIDFFLYQNYRTSGRELSLILLSGTFLSFLSTFVIVSKPSNEVCMTTRFAVGFCYTGKKLKENFIYVLVSLADKSVSLAIQICLSS